MDAKPGSWSSAWEPWCQVVIAVARCDDGSLLVCSLVYCVFTGNLLGQVRFQAVFIAVSSSLLSRREQEVLLLF